MTETAAVPASREYERAARVYQWAWLRTHVTTYSWRQSWTPQQAAFLLVVIPLFAAGPLDNLIGPFHFELSDWQVLGRVSDRAFAAALGGFWLVNALLFEHLLSRRCRPDVEVRGWVRALRFVLGGLPLVGLLISIPVWERLVERSPRWAFRRLDAGPPLELSSARRRAFRAFPIPAGLELRIRRFEESALWLIWAWAVSFVVLLAVSIWLGRPEPSPARYFAAVVLWGILHFSAAAAMAYYGRRQARRLHGLRAHFLRLMPGLCLLPFSLAIALVFLAVETDRARTDSLTFAAHGRGTSVGRLPRWRQAQQGLRRDWSKLPLWARFARPRGAEKAAEVSNVQHHLLSFYRLKTFALFFDGALLGWVLASARQSLPKIAATVVALETAIVWTLGGIGVLGALWLAAELARLLAGAFWILPRRERVSRGWYLACGALAALAGFYTGGYSEHLATREIGMLVIYGAALCAMLCGFRVVLFPLLKGGSREASELYPTVLWAVFFIAISAAGGLLALGSEAAERCLKLILCGAWLSPLWQAALGTWFLGWILHPVLLKDLRSGAVSTGVRKPLAFLAFTAVAPWGGLAIPLWIFLRQRYGQRLRAAWLELDRTRRATEDRDPLTCRRFETRATGHE